MKKLILILMLMCLPAVVFAQNPQGIRFEQKLSWQQVLAKAKAESKYIFVDCYATWCQPCNQMDKDVYPLEQVGSVFNEKFISVKVQMDITPKDSEQIKNWYADAKQLKETHKVNSMPTFLFFSPEGSIVHRSMGARKPNEMIELGEIATDPARQSYVLLEKYKQGSKDYPTLGALARLAKITGDQQLALTIAEDYKKNYLDKVSDEVFATKDNLGFLMSEFPQVTQADGSKGRLFAYAYRHPAKVDQILGFPNVADFHFRAVVKQEEIERKLWASDKAERPTKSNPDWNKIASAIRRKYPEYKEVDEFVSKEQVAFYERAKNWKQWVRHQDRRLAMYPPKAGAASGVSPGMAVFYELNAPAWTAFINSNDKAILERALAWIDLAVKLDEAHQYLDTKANILYKLGRTTEAIATQERAIEVSSAQAKKNKVAVDTVTKDYLAVVDKMKKGEPTYVDQGAIWDKTASPIRSN